MCDERKSGRGCGSDAYPCQVEVLEAARPEFVQE